MAAMRKEGPCGGLGGSAKDMDTTGITRIVKVAIRSGTVIDAINVYFERNGTTESTDFWGGDGGSLTEINLQPTEYINSVRGYYGTWGAIFVVRSLVLETNLATYGPCGMEEGIPFELSVPGSQIIGFHGRSGQFLDAIGVYVQGLTLTKKVGPCGGDGGLEKDMDITGVTRINKLSILSGDYLTAITVSFERNGSTESTDIWGGNDGFLTEINFEPNEYITSVRGYVGNYGDLFIVRSLELKTNLASYGPYGISDGTPFELSALDGQQIIGFHARSGTAIDAIGVYIQAPRAASTEGTSN